MNEMEELRRETERALAHGRRAIAKMQEAREYLKLFHPTDITPIPLRRAICHPILGGILRKNEADVPGPTFSENSLRLAINKGHLKCTWVAGKQHVTPDALREWLATANDTRKSTTQRVVELSPKAKTHHEKQQAKASVSVASAKLLSMKAALAAKKKGK